MQKSLFSGIIALATVLVSLFWFPPGVCFIVGVALIWATLVIRALMGEMSKKADNILAILVLFLSAFTIIMNVGFYVPF